MPRNASGVYSLPEPPVVTATLIESADENSTRNDLAAEITNSLDRNGRGAMLASLKLFDGTEALPGLTFALDPNTGMWRSGNDAAALVVGGAAAISLNTTQVLLRSAGIAGAGYLGAVNGFQLDASVPLGWSSGAVPGSNEVELRRDAADTLAQRRGTNAQVFRLYNTFTDASNYERIALRWTANTAYLLIEGAGTGSNARELAIGTGGSGSIYFQTGGTNRWAVANAGHLLASTDNTYDIGASGATRPRIVYAGTSIVTPEVSTGTLNASGAIAQSGVLSPSQITGNQNDYSPGSLSTASILRINTDARRNITGLAGGIEGRNITIFNVGTFPAVLTYEDAASSAANRFAFGLTLGGGQSVDLVYDDTSDRWRARALPEPLGTIKDFGGGTIPAGWLGCDAAAVSRTTYASLYNEIGTTWGVGDGSTTFNVPDFRRRAAVGSGGSGTGTLGNAVGNTGGAETHTLTTAELAVHAHTETVIAIGGGSTLMPNVDGTGTSSQNAGITTANAGSGSAHNNMQPSAVVLKIIKYS